MGTLKGLVQFTVSVERLSIAALLLDRLGIDHLKRVYPRQDLPVTLRIHLFHFVNMLLVNG